MTSVRVLTMCYLPASVSWMTVQRRPDQWILFQTMTVFTWRGGLNEVSERQIARALLQEAVCNLVPRFFSLFKMVARPWEIAGHVSLCRAEGSLLAIDYHVINVISNFYWRHVALLTCEQCFWLVVEWLCLCHMSLTWAISWFVWKFISFENTKSWNTRFGNHSNKQRGLETICSSLLKEHLIILYLKQRT